MIRRLLLALVVLLGVGLALAWPTLKNAWRAMHPRSDYDHAPVALPADLAPGWRRRRNTPRRR